MAKRTVDTMLRKIPLEKIEAYLKKQKKSADKEARKLIRRRKILLASLKKVDTKLSALGAKTKAKVKRARRKKAAPKAPKRKRAQAGNLNQAILKVFASQKKPLRPAEIVQHLIRRRLYKRGKSLYTQVMQKLRTLEGVKKSARGTYVLSRAKTTSTRKKRSAPKKKK